MNKETIRVILPNKKINIFSISIIILGFLTGCIFLIMLKETDKVAIIEQIKEYFITLKDNKYNIGTSFKNGLIMNNIYIIVMWILGLSIVGLILHIFILYIKGFIVGFSMSAIMLTFKIKGLFVGLLYLIFGQLLNILEITILGIYGISFTIFLIKTIFKKSRGTTNNRKEIKKYLTMLICLLLIAIISTCLETIILPTILKLIIKWLI